MAAAKKTKRAKAKRRKVKAQKKAQVAVVKPKATFVEALKDDACVAISKIDDAYHMSAAVESPAGWQHLRDAAANSWADVASRLDTWLYGDRQMDDGMALHTLHLLHALSGMRNLSEWGLTVKEIRDLVASVDDHEWTQPDRRKFVRCRVCGVAKRPDGKDGYCL